MKKEILEQLEFYIKNKIHLLKNSHETKYKIAIKELDSVLARIEHCIAEDKCKRKKDAS